MRADLERQISDAQSALNVLMNRPAQSALGEPSVRPCLLNTIITNVAKHRAGAAACSPGAQARLEAERFESSSPDAKSFPDPALNVKAQRYNDAVQAVSEVDIGV